jgi:hypothetical protein
MLCTCGLAMCYICRANITKEKYAHFCQKPHCSHKSCGQCILYTDTIEDDRKAMLEAGIATAAEVATETAAPPSLSNSTGSSGGGTIEKSRIASSSSAVGAVSLGSRSIPAGLDKVQYAARTR